MKNTDIIGYLILSGFRLRDLDLECMDFFHGNVHPGSPAYNWSIIYTLRDNDAQVSDSEGWIPFSGVIDSQETLDKVIGIYMEETRLKYIKS